MALQPRIDYRADKLEKMREMDHAGDGQVDDMMLAGEVAALFESAFAVCGVRGDAEAVMRIRIQQASLDAVALVTEDFRRRELLA